jgi:uncharacterized protein YbaP (TraB family)
MNKTAEIIYSCILAMTFFIVAIDAQALESSECEPLVVRDKYDEEKLEFGDGILWKVSRNNNPHSYIFGTIHVADKKILNLPEEVEQALYSSKIFVMEALPDLGQAAIFSASMFYTDGRTLDQVISNTLFQETVNILKNYMIPEQLVNLMKPWAAYITMNYPSEMGTVLDLELMSQARNNGAEIKGLETLIEQGEIFSTLEEKIQVKLLLDSACNYGVLTGDFEKMKDFYLSRDLSGLANYGNRYEMSEDADYLMLMDLLLINRNQTMVERMQETLNTGGGFIAIGALHLPGEEGVLHLLHQKGYSIDKIY